MISSTHRWLCRHVDFWQWALRLGWPRGEDALIHAAWTQGLGRLGKSSPSAAAVGTSPLWPPRLVPDGGLCSPRWHVAVRRLQLCRCWLNLRIPACLSALCTGLAVSPRTARGSFGQYSPQAVGAPDDEVAPYVHVLSTAQRAR